MKTNEQILEEWFDTPDDPTSEWPDNEILSVSKGFVLELISLARQKERERCQMLVNEWFDSNERGPSRLLLRISGREG